MNAQCLLLLVVSAAVLSAQGFTGYGYIGGGTTTHGSASLLAPAGPGASHLAFGAGFEVDSPSGVGAGVEVGGLNPEGPAKTLGFASFNGFLHLMRNRPSPWDPFLTAGYSRLFRTVSPNGWNVGGGFNYWFQPRAAVRFEVRDLVVSVPGGTQQSWSVGFGVGFR